MQLKCYFLGFFQSEAFIVKCPVVSLTQKFSFAPLSMIAPPVWHRNIFTQPSLRLSKLRRSFIFLIKHRVKSISARKGKLCGNFSLQSDKPDKKKKQKLMSSKNHSCIFFLGLDTYCEGAISQVDDAMLSVIAKLKNPVLKNSTANL